MISCLFAAFLPRAAQDRRTSCRPSDRRLPVWSFVRRVPVIGETAMQVNLNALAGAGQPERASISFEGEVDLRGLSRYGEHPILAPARVCGQARRERGAILVRYRADYHTSRVCSRCLCPIEREQTLENEHAVVFEDGGDAPEEAVHAPGGLLDMAALIGADVSLCLDSAPLCREDCAGLCEHCGCNRNETACGCAQTHDQTDPRFAALTEYLQEQSDNRDPLSKGGAGHGSPQEETQPSAKK